MGVTNGSLSQIIRKSDNWILHEPNKFKILGMFSIIYVAMATIEILHFNVINVMSYEYIFSVPNLSFIPAMSLE